MMKTLFVRWLGRFQPSEALVLGGAALLVGLTSGAGVWLFKWLITWRTSPLSSVSAEC